MKTILTAVDFSPITPKVLAGAAALARATGSTLVILNVAEPAAAYVPVGAAMDVITAPVPLEPPDLDVVKARLEELAAPLRTEGLGVETKTVVGLPAEEILSAATESKAEMIVLGSHGHGAVYQLFAGSIVTAVLHKASIPVTVIPVHWALLKHIAESDDDRGLAWVHP
jgi:nucleotide-binding universal stress UspA family protein